MSDNAPVQRVLIAFDGAVEWRAASGPVNLELRGFERAAGEPRGRRYAQVLFNAASGARPPSALRDVRIVELQSVGGQPGGQRKFRIEARGASIADVLGDLPGDLPGDVPGEHTELLARGVELHRAAAAPFFAAVPPLAVPVRVRLGWSLLLALLRIPGAAFLVAKLRGST